MNQVVLSGNLGKDPEGKTGNADKKAYTTFSIAVNDPFDKDKPTWVNIKTFGKTAEFAKEYLKKGTSIIVSGRLSIEKSLKGEGYYTSVMADRVEFAGNNRKTDVDDTHGEKSLDELF